MIIKGLFRRYQKWNPVHPTSGAFWGMGVGIGCGVGWGPGFGPEVVGYVGAGCGVGFSVGITFAGFGIGLPAKILIEGPYKVVAATSSHTWDLVRSSNFLTVKNEAGDELGRNMPLFPSQLWNLQQKANERLSYFRDLDLLKKGTEIFNVERSISLCTKSISESCTSLRNRFSDKDDKE
ncbi:cadmium-induced protein AS8 [Silene latifolia]|uniref:cadmium-induced protein AS8 n=1 Tax=Silene latifolia TaxID=37657 RepID=UPI003D785B58